MYCIKNIFFVLFSVACSTVTVTKCQAALRTLQAFPFFKPTCLCKEPNVDPECNSFRDFLFDHPCVFVLKKGTYPSQLFSPAFRKNSWPSCALLNISQRKLHQKPDTHLALADCLYTISYSDSIPPITLLCWIHHLIDRQLFSQQWFFFLLSIKLSVNSVTRYIEIDTFAENLFYLVCFSATARFPQAN